MSVNYTNLKVNAEATIVIKDPNLLNLKRAQSLPNHRNIVHLPKTAEMCHFLPST